MSNGQDGSGYGVFGQRYDSSSSKVGSEFQVNTYTNNDQSYPSVSKLQNGGFVIAWQSYAQDTSGWGIYGQRYDSSGNKLGSEFQVNSYTVGDQDAPSIAWLNNGGFAVAWRDGGRNGGGGYLPYDQAYAQVYDSSGNKLFVSEFCISDNTLNTRSFPQIASFGNNFVISYSADNGVRGYSCAPNLYAKIYDLTGKVVVSEFKINTSPFTQCLHFENSVATLSNGNFVVTWDQGQSGSKAILAQIYNMQGNKVGSELKINSYTDGYQENPAIIGLDNGEFIVVWQSYNQDSSSKGIFGRRYYANGDAATGVEFQINDDASVSDKLIYQYVLPYKRNFPSIAKVEKGFIVTWMNNAKDGDGWGIFAKMFLTASTADTMIPNWPDAIRCDRYSDPATYAMVLVVHNASNDPGSVSYQWHSVK
jgi:hypothetical protein